MSDPVIARQIRHVFLPPPLPLPPSSNARRSLFFLFSGSRSAGRTSESQARVQPGSGKDFVFLPIKKEILAEGFSLSKMGLDPPVILFFFLFFFIKSRSFVMDAPRTACRVLK